MRFTVISHTPVRSRYKTTSLRSQWVMNRIHVVWANWINIMSADAQLLVSQKVHFTNDFSITPLKDIILLQNFAHATTAQLLCHVQNFIGITSLQLRWDQNEISIEFELRWKNCSWNGSQIIYSVNLWTESPRKEEFCALSCVLKIWTDELSVTHQYQRMI